MAAAKQVKIVSGKLQQPKDIHNFTDDEWVSILQTQEKKTTQSLLEMCYAWYKLFEAMRSVNEDTEVTEMDEVRFKDICEQCGISRATASKRVGIGANAELLAPYLDSIPSSVEPLIAICRIPDEQLTVLLEEKRISPETTREEAKWMKDSVKKAKSSAKYEGDLLGYMDENPYDVDAEPEQKETGGKKAKEKVKELKENSSKEETAKSARLQKMDSAIDFIVDVILQPEHLDNVIETLKSSIEGVEVEDRSAELKSSIDKAVETIKLVSGGYE